jgi:hypothetical protein
MLSHPGTPVTIYSTADILENVSARLLPNRTLKRGVKGLCPFIKLFLLKMRRHEKSWILTNQKIGKLKIKGPKMVKEIFGKTLDKKIVKQMLMTVDSIKRFHRLLTATNDLGFSTFDYAEDIVIIVQGKFAYTVREIMQSALNMIAKWAVKEDFNISPHKTANPIYQ